MWSGLEYDMNIWFRTGEWMSQGTNIYLPNDHIGYPPLWALWCLIANRVFYLAGSSMEIWRFTIKLPLILAQFALAFVMARFAEKRFDQRTVRRIFWITLTWSFFIYISALWGQLNVLSAQLTFLSFYAVVNQRISVGALLLGAAVTLKIYPLVALPAFLIFLLKNQNKKKREQREPKMSQRKK